MVTLFPCLSLVQKVRLHQVDFDGVQSISIRKLQSSRTLLAVSFNGLHIPSMLRCERSHFFGESYFRFGNLTDEKLRNTLYCLGS